MLLRVASAAATLYVLGLALFAALNRLLASPPAWIALPNLFAPLWFLPLLLLVPLALWAPSPWLRGATLSLGALFVLLFGGWLVPRAPLPEGNLRLVTFNHFAENRDAARIVAALRDHEADVIALQELSPEVAQALEAMPEFPYRALEPSSAAAQHETTGLGLLSRYPLTHVVHDPHLRFQRAELDLHGRRVTLFNVHLPTPFGPPRVSEGVPFSTVLSYDAGVRGEVLGALLERFAQTQGPLIVLGDFNLSDFEAAYHGVASSLTNVYRRSTRGFGFTFPNRSRLPPFPFLRIDHIWVGGGVRPAAAGVDCRPTGSDHCLLWGGVAVP